MNDVRIIRKEIRPSQDGLIFFTVGRYTILSAQIRPNRFVALFYAFDGPPIYVYLKFLDTIMESTFPILDVLTKAYDQLVGDTMDEQLSSTITKLTKMIHMTLNAINVYAGDEIFVSSLYYNVREMVRFGHANPENNYLWNREDLKTS